MHPVRVILALAFFAAASASAAVVYKWTDRDGVVHYSDQPIEGAQQIITSTGTSNGISAGSPLPLSPQRGASPAVVPSVFSIESPVSDQVFFGDDIVSVRLHVEPALSAAQEIAWTLNGVALTDPGPQSTSFTLPGLPRGAYTLTATMTGGTTQTSTVAFVVREPSVLAPQHKKP